MRRPSLRIPLLALAIGLAAAAPAPAAPAAPSPFAGTASAFTSRGFPVVVEVSRDGRQVTRAVAGLRLSCSNGEFANVDDLFTKLPLSASGRASRRYAGGTGVGWDGAPATFSGFMSVSISRRTRALTGVWQLTETAVQPDGSTRVCSSGTVRVKGAGRSASNPLGGSYGGFTSKGAPVVVQVAADGRRVTEISGMFDLRCGPGAFRFVNDSWVKLPLSGGSNRFSLLVRNETFRFSDGSSIQESAALSGVVDRLGRAVKGRWRTVWTIPAGSTELCTSGQVTFRATR